MAPSLLIFRDVGGRDASVLGQAGLAGGVALVPPTSCPASSALRSLGLTSQPRREVPVA